MEARLVAVPQRLRVVRLRLEDVAEVLLRLLVALHLYVNERPITVRAPVLVIFLQHHVAITKTGFQLLEHHVPGTQI